MNDRLGVLSSTRYVVDHARHVRIDGERLAAVCRDAAISGITPPSWNRDLHYTGEAEATAMYVLVLDSLNFCFWGEPRWKVRYAGQELDGYWALAAALKRAIEEGVPLLDASYLADLQEADLATILRGSAPIPLLSERLANLRELGHVLQDRYGGRCTPLIASAQGDAVALVHTIARQLSSFNDIASYDGRTVRFYKRAQILVGDLAGSLNSQGLGAFANLHELTAFADYKLPQILRHFGILVYADDLACLVDNQTLLPAGCADEVEIRAHTIWAVELMRRELAASGRSYPAYQLDWWLWEASQHMAGPVRPYHRTRTIYY